jgi:hypothetical protein
MFSPRTRWVGLRLNRCGSFAHVLQVGCTLGLIRYRFHKAAISYTQLNEPQRSLTIQQVRHIRTCQADGTNWPRDTGHHRSHYEGGKDLLGRASAPRISDQPGRPRSAGPTRNAGLRANNSAENF